MAEYDGRLLDAGPDPFRAEPSGGRKDVDLFLAAGELDERTPPEQTEAMERALQAAPQDTSVMDALGDVLLRLGEAERAFEVGARLDRRAAA